MSLTLSSISPPSIPSIGNPQSAIQANRPDSSPENDASGVSASSDTPRTVNAASETEQSSQQTPEQRQEQRIIEQLSARDREVRQHELAHQSAGAGLTGAASFSYERGPDGTLYAVGGEVSIDTSAVSGDPRATLEKAEAIIRAAMAPAEPSSQDYRVAASAQAMAAEARAELAQLEESQDGEQSGDESAPAAESASDTQEKEAARKQALAEERTEQTEATGRLQTQLVESGVFSRLYPPGTLFSYQV